MSHVFISYKRDDQAYARKLADHLIEQGFDIWIDDRIDYGEEWWEVIVEAITNCVAFIVIMTPKSHTSKWVKRELRIADHKDKPLFPLLLDGENWPIFYGTLYADVSNNDLPPSDFCDRLAKCAPRQAQAGIDVTEAPPPPEPAPVIIPVPEPSFTLPMLEWCDIPGVENYHLLTNQGDKGTYDIAPFRMAKYLVTYAQFRAFIDAPDGFHNGRWWQGLAADEKHRSAPGEQRWPIDNHPRERVSWYDAVAFSRWLSEKLGYEVRLPTEWEWQWAAQGSDKREYPWGNGFDESRCNTGESGIEQTTPVDKYPSGAGPFGVMDMAGNVWEWCLNEPSNPENISFAGNAARVLRGGSWGLIQDSARCASRGYYIPDDRDLNLGFRVCASPFSK